MQSVTYPISTTPQSIPEPKKMVHSWLVNHHFVCLFKSGNKLTYETWKRSTEEVIGRASISYAGCINSVIEIMKTRHALLKQSGQVVFCPLYKTWSLTAKTVRLIKYNNQLSWSVSFTSSFDVVRPFIQSTIPSIICHPETQSIIEGLKTKKNFEIISWLDKDFIVTRVLEEEEFKKEYKERKEPKINHPPRGSLVTGVVESTALGAMTAFGCTILNAAGITFSQTTLIGGLATTFGSLFVGGSLPLIAYAGYHIMKNSVDKEEEVVPFRPIERPLFIEIEPMSIKSRIDERARVSKFTWSVTVIVGPQGCAYNHTSVFIEGIASSSLSFGVPEGQYFMFKAHLIPPVKIKSVCLHKFKELFNDFVKRSPIFMRSSVKVARMITEIIKERNEQAEILSSGKQIEWSVLGKYSKHSDGTHSCMTWAMEKLALSDIDLEISKNPDSIIIPRMKTEDIWCYQRVDFSPQI